MELPALAHTRQDAESGSLLRHDLVDHLTAVSKLAAQFASTFGPDWAALAGLWHDLGKFRIGFRRYIHAVQGTDAHLEGKWPTNSEKSHSAAGALHALNTFEQAFGPNGRLLARVLAYAIAGHHAGLADWTGGLDARLLGTGANDSRREHDEAHAGCTTDAPHILALPESFDWKRACALIPAARSDNPLAWSLWIRMLFSALVDADFLDTEQFMDEERGEKRNGFESIAYYCESLDHHLDQLKAEVASKGKSDDAVMRARDEVLTQCRKKAAQPPGVFTLTVPTGGGKTLSSLAFALRHAVAHNKRRVIYAIPYTSIIEQTAEIFGRIFGKAAVVEHHSQVDVDPASETARGRLACENWDAPLIVTTNVQLFESLFAAKTSRCRKLHRIAESVIVLDEAQMLPPEFLQPTLDALNLLVEHYGVTIVVCTATQPVLTTRQRFDPRDRLRGLATPHPIIDDPNRLFTALKRVDIKWPDDLQTPWPTQRLVSDVANEDCVLVVTNTRADATEIMGALEAATGEPALHLSAAMCGQHRADVLREIRARLVARRLGQDARALRVVSTQLIEAGVDIDFPVVFRALAGLDSIAQSAGRCNREGQLPHNARGRVVVFVREVPRRLTNIQHGIDATRITLSTGLDDALTPSAFDRYFPTYHSSFANLDAHGIVALLKNNRELDFGFRSAADAFRFIEDESAAVIVPYKSTSEDARHLPPLITKLRNGEADRWLLRALQRYTVGVPTSEVRRLQTQGSVVEAQPGCFVLTDSLQYDDRLGLLRDHAAPRPTSLVV